MEPFGKQLREKREALAENDDRFSLRQVAKRIGVQPSYLSKVEREYEGPPSEARIRQIAAELEEDPDEMLASAGKVSADLKEVIIERPRLFADLLRQLKNAPDDAVLRIVRQVRDGNW